MTTVVNIKKEKCDVKVCRTPKNEILSPPHPSCCGNPFYLKNVHDTVERDKIVEQYKEYFFKRIENEPDFKEYVLTLKDKKLGCFCAPSRCHAHIIAEYLDG